MMSTEDSEDDDWIFDTVRTYKNLYMYDLMNQVTAMDWITHSGKCRSLCISTSNGKKHELAELFLPERLLKQSNQEAGLVKDRDFHMNSGGFSENFVTSMKHVPDTSVIVTSPSDSDASIELWQLGRGDTDMMSNIGTIQNAKGTGSPSRLCIEEDSKDIIFGSHLNNLCVTDAESQKIKMNSTELKNELKINYMEVIDRNTLICCGEESGDLYVLDLRDTMSKVKGVHLNDAKEPGGGAYWTGCFHGDYCTEISSSGVIRVCDVRQLDNTLSRRETGLSCQGKFDYITTKLKIIQNRLQVSVSGFDRNVQLFCLDMNGDEDRKKVIQPSFVHEGHHKNCSNKTNSLNIVTHILHPLQNNWILSAATDGSLHAWERNENVS